MTICLKTSLGGSAFLGAHEWGLRRTGSSLTQERTMSEAVSQHLFKGRRRSRVFK